MQFDFITDLTDVTTVQVAVNIYNLGLMYFYYIIAKDVMHMTIKTFRKGGKNVRRSVK